MKLIYIAGKYRGKKRYHVKENIMFAERFQLELTKKYPEYFFVVPHVMTAAVDGVHDDQYFLDGTLEVLKRCDGIYLLPNWEHSEGAKFEYDYALKNGIKDYTEELEI